MHPNRLASLDGWRAVSIIMVLGSHCKFSAGFPDDLAVPFEWLFDGDLGVRFFFVISGFLITWLMLNESHRQGRVSLKAFYVRRSLRILPVYCAFLLCVVGLQFFTRYQQSTLAWFGNLTFTTNFLGSEFTTGHLWSLSTEEQFYLLWPGIFSLLRLGSHSHQSLQLLAIPILIAPCCRVMGYTGYPACLSPMLGHFSFFAYFDSLAIGCAAAILLSRKPEAIKKFVGAPAKFSLAVSR